MFLNVFFIFDSGKLLHTQKTIRFKYEGFAYKQVDDVGMGDLLGSTLDDLFLRRVGKTVHANIVKDFLCERFMNDTVIFIDNDHFVTVLQILIFMHPNLSMRR